MADPRPAPVSDSYPLSRRIAVLGKGGKSTLARALADRFELDFVELDDIRHMAGWVERDDDDMRDVVVARLDGAQTGWVTDGNYSDIREVIFDRAETVIVLALPWRIMLWRTLKRTLRRAITREELWNGNRESFRETFLSRDSVVYDLWRRRHHYRGLPDAITAEVPDGVELRIIRSTRELRALYKSHDLVRN